VKVPDLNLLICVVDEEASQHEPALTWWNSLLSGIETVG